MGDRLIVTLSDSEGSLDAVLSHAKDSWGDLKMTEKIIKNLMGKGGKKWA